MARMFRVLSGIFAHVMTLYFLWATLTHPNTTWWTVCVGGLLGFMLVDALTLFIHYALDNYFSPDTPIIGKTVYYFRQHHHDWGAMFARDFFDNNFENALFAASCGVFVAFGSPSAMTCAMMSVAILGGTYVSQIHKWAHADSVPRPVLWLQRSGVIIDKAYHDVHHDDAQGNYGLFAGWLEPMFDALRVFMILEYIIYLLTGEVALEGRAGFPEDDASFRERYERVYWHFWYTFLSAYTEATGATFHCMNWGFDEPGLDLGDEVGAERYPLQLYEKLVEGMQLQGKALLDASCGRGGGAHYLHTAKGLARTRGVDFTPAHVELCRRAFGDTEGLSFVQGNAEHLPVDPGAFDVVVSVEASHCYGDISRFTASAYDALAPGGWLLWTDFAPVDKLPQIKRALRAQGFEPHLEMDVTQGVLRAMKKDAARRERLITEHSATILQPLLRNFAASDERADTVRRMVRGDYIYFMWRVRKPAAEAP